MIYPSPDKIDDAIDSKYKLVILASKRSKQIKEGARTFVTPPDSTNPITIALEEIAAKKITYAFDENSLAGREARADEQAVVGARNVILAPGVDPLAAPEDIDKVAEARAMLGGDADVAAIFSDDDDDNDGTFLPEIDDEEEDNPLSTDDEGDAGDS
ncbi:MAG: DNA-directed RNA polymerase subunit omega [Armatimonadetes bacterium]|nr:DNA-directed RNA polymerase subunit omega [Armatimonadota bacterium]